MEYQKWNYFSYSFSELQIKWNFSDNVTTHSQDYKLDEMEYFSDNVTRLNIYSSHEKDWTMIHKFPVLMAESKARKLHHHVSNVNVVLILF